jgi:pimeloyl-ACP methyl ester carboxylesterase
MARTRWRYPLVVATLVLAACSGHSAGDGAGPATPVARAVSRLRDLPLPPPVSVRDHPDGGKLSDPAFEPLPGAHAEYGMLRGSTYQIEIPEKWNGRLVLWMHGFEDFVAAARATPPDIRHYLISHGFAWGASSFSSTSIIPGRSADETAALWDFFVRKHGRPKWTYVGGQSMGGWATNIAAARYGNRFDGALGLCGAAGTTPGLRISGDFFVAAAFVAAVTQRELDATTDFGTLLDRRIRPALADARKHEQYENIIIDITGGPRAFAREGIHLEEETNFHRAVLGIAAGVIPQPEAPYRLGPASGVTSAVFNRDAVRVPTRAAALRTFSEGMEVTGDLQMPLLTLHTTGDGQTPIDQAQILRQRVRAKGRSARLVQRVFEDAGHCGFTTGEQETAFAALVDWVERGRVPTGTNLDNDDLGALDRTFEVAARPGSSAANEAAGARGRTVLSGGAHLDGVALDARWVGAVVRRNGLVTPCNFGLPPIQAGRYEITVFGENESAGCGQPGAEILLWTFANDRQFFSTGAIPWSATGKATFDVDFSSSRPFGTSRRVTEFSSEVYRADDQRLPSARVEAFVGDTLCGVASARSGTYILSVVGPDSVAGCRAGARLAFRVDGKPAAETSTNTFSYSGQLDLTQR